MGGSTLHSWWAGAAPWPGLGGQFSASYGWAYGAQTRRLVAFSLDGEETLPPQPDPFVPVPIEADFAVDAAWAEQGAQAFGLCAACHGPGVVSAGMAPDLRASSIVTTLEPFAGVVRDGTLAFRGMPAYADITFDQLTGLQHYIRQQAEVALAAGEEGGGRE